MEFYSLEKSDKPVRVQWYTNEYSSHEHSEHNYNYQTRVLKGIAEDGSEWSMAVDVNIHDDDDWYEIDDAYMESEPGTVKDMMEPINFSPDEIYWSDMGWKNKWKKYKNIETQKYFNNLLGEYPNVDPIKNEYSEKIKEDPINRIFNRIGSIPSHKITDTPGKGVEFLRVPNDVDSSSNLIVKLTDTGIFKNNIDISLKHMSQQHRDILNLASRELFNGDVPRNT